MAPISSPAAMALAVSLFPCVVATVDSCSQTPESMAAVAETIGVAAKVAGFEVFVGQAGWYLSCMGHNGDDDPNCAGDNNPDGSYMQFAFPVDGSETGIMPPGLCEVNSFETCFDNITVSVPMGIQDAIVFLGCTPPESAYFAFDLLVASRIEEGPQPLNDMSFIYPGCPFGDALNTLSAPFSKHEPTVVVQAFDNATAELVRMGLEASKDADDVKFHVHELNSSLVRTWENHTQPVNVTRPDSFRSMVRWSVPDPSVPTNDIIDYGDTTWPVLLLRKKVNEPKELLQPALLRRPDGKDENKLFGTQLASVQQSIVDWMKTQYKMSLTGTAQLDLQYAGMTDDWAGVLDGSIPGDYLNTRDAVYGYPWYDDNLDDAGDERVPRELSAGGVAFFVGVVHTTVGKTIYNSVTLASDDMTYSHSYLNKESAGGTPSMVGSAAAFASLTNATGFVSATDLAALYTLAWRRNSSSFPCPATAAAFCETLPNTGAELPADDEVYLLEGDERAYLNPRTLTGPDPNELFGGTLLLFGPDTQ